MQDSTANGCNGEIEQFLIARKLVSAADLERAKRLCEDTGLALVCALGRTAAVQSHDLAQALSTFYDAPKVRADQWPAAPAHAEKLSPAFLRERKFFPLCDGSDGLRVAMADPGDDYGLQAVRLATGQSIAPRIATPEDIDAAIERWTASIEDADPMSDPAASGLSAPDTSEDIEHLRDMALDTPVVQLVNQLIQDAVNARATDIHIEPFGNRINLRIRVDGMLRDVRPPPAHMARAIISRIKILSGLDIAERRLPQDGRARLGLDGRLLDLRIATMPTIHGESVAIRLLDNVRRTLDFARLGFATRDKQRLFDHLGAPHGMIIVTGPTGSGKTTTLATALSTLNQTHRKILTIEDPIEYELDGVNQTQAKPAIGLTFAAAMRSFLRHDPDVIMVGEMRDGETARIGVHAALTGHLVLTTLHTNSAAGAVARLLDMGIDAYLLASSLRCIAGQRLVRRLCTNCRQPSESPPDLPPAMLDVLTRLAGSQKPKLWMATGCERCINTGYSDRTVIAELLNVDEDIRALLKPGCPAGRIEAAARRNGMTSMVSDGLQKCLDGLTTIDEIRRVALDVEALP